MDLMEAIRNNLGPFVVVLVIVSICSFLGILTYGTNRGVAITYERARKDGQQLIGTLTANGFTIQNATANWPIITVTLNSLNALIDKATELNTTTIYETNAAGALNYSFLILDSDGIGYSYTFTEPYVAWAFP